VPGEGWKIAVTSNNLMLHRRIRPFIPAALHGTGCPVSYYFYQISARLTEPDSSAPLGGGITSIPRTGEPSAIHRALMRGEDGEGGRRGRKTSGINGINKLHKKQ